MPNNGLINTASGTIHGAYAIRNNAQGLTNSVQQGVQSGQITPADHKEIAAERKVNGALLNRDKANGPVTAQERAQIRARQGAIAQQIDNFQAGS